MRFVYIYIKLYYIYIIYYIYIYYIFIYIIYYIYTIYIHIYKNVVDKYIQIFNNLSLAKHNLVVRSVCLQCILDAWTWNSTSPSPPKKERFLMVPGKPQPSHRTPFRSFGSPNSAGLGDLSYLSFIILTLTCWIIMLRSTQIGGPPNHPL